jgi:hypothetical protein
VGSDDTPIKKTEEKKTRPAWKESKMGGASVVWTLLKTRAAPLVALNSQRP